MRTVLHRIYEHTYSQNDHLIQFCIRVLLLILLANTTCLGQISPGELAKPHADLEGVSNCIKCHELGSSIQNDKCLACHKEIQNRLDVKSGLHYQEVVVAEKNCALCHADHAGRSFDMIFWENGKDNFDHKRTEFELRGKHSEIKCEKCHKPEFVKDNLKIVQEKIDLNKTFLGLHRECLACHVDEHRGQLSDDCAKCHNEKDWKPAEKFDHDNAKFKLTGKHINVDCTKCHKPVRDAKAQSPLKTMYAQYVDLDFATCQSCHEDVHKGRLGSDCQSCHETENWQKTDHRTFDHAKTRFPLQGKHKTVDCIKCHTSGKMVQPLQFASCQSCHEDVHKGKFKQDCTSCHTESDWHTVASTSFDHQKTGFPLKGLHANVECKKCHTTGNMTVALKSDHCSECHEDIHKGQFAHRKDGGLCESCHDEQAFIPGLFTVDQHQNLAFKLTGAHLAINCRSCHKEHIPADSVAIRQFIFESTNCEECHEDPHFGQFKERKPAKICEQCHQTSAWQELKFDHDKDSRFALEGAHKKVACNDCHKNINTQGKSGRLYRPIDPACETCHKGNSSILENREKLE